MSTISGQTETIHRNSPVPVKTRDYEATGEAIVNVVEQSLYNRTLMRDAARAKIAALDSAGTIDTPTKWQDFVDCANAIVEAAWLAHSQEQRVRLANTGLPYLRELLGHIKHEEAKRQKDRGFFVTAQEIDAPGGVDYLIDVLNTARTHNQDVHFEY